jgi:threonine dehydratase
MLPHSWFAQAAERLSSQAIRTPLTYDSHLDIYLKWENHQATGSFKVRGALNKVLTLQPWEREVGIVTASAGNHGLGVAYAAQAAGSPVIVFASETASAIKLQGIRKLGAEVILVPGGYGDAEAAGIDYARTHSKTWISAYNDGMVIAGQGTIGPEILDQLPERSHFFWIIPSGGGGLACGIATAVKSQSAEKPSTHHLFAVQSEASSYMYAAYYTGSQEGVLESNSLADGLAGPIEHGSITIPLARRYLDGVLLVSEADIAQAISYAWHHYHEVIEASAATSLAAVLSGKFTNRPAILIISGGNINPETHQKLIALQT